MPGKFFNKFNFIFIAFVGLTILFGLTVMRPGFYLDLPLIRTHVARLLICWVLTFFFLLLSSWKWKIACQSQQIFLPLKEALSVTLVASFVDLVVFPSRISSDVYRAANLRQHGLKNTVVIIAIYRVGTLCAYLLGVPFVLIKMGLPSGWVLLSILLTLLFTGFLLKTYKLTWPQGTALAAVTGLTMILFFTESIRSWILLSLFYTLPFRDILNTFFLSQTAGALSGIPLGLGLKDFSWGIFLKTHLSPGQLTMFLILLRITGELTSATAGWLISGGKIWQWIKTNKKNKTVIP